MAIEDDIRLALRDYKTVTATYPLGDPSSPVWNPPKKTLRDAFISLSDQLGDATSNVLGLYDNITKAIKSENRTVATAGQTSFTFNHEETTVSVYVNGVRLQKDIDYTSNGSSVTLTSAASSGDIFQAEWFGLFYVSSGISPEAYGAISDGVANDTASLQAAVTAALASGEEVVANGTYLTTSSIDNLHDVKITGTGSIKRGSDTWQINLTGFDRNILYVAPTGVAGNDGLSADQPTTFNAAWDRMKLLGPKASDGKWRIQMAGGTFTEEGVVIADWPFFRNQLEIRGTAASLTDVPTTVWDGTGKATYAAIRGGLTNSESGYLNAEFESIKFTGWSQNGIVYWHGGRIKATNLHADGIDLPFDYRGIRIDQTHGVIANADFGLRAYHHCSSTIGGLNAGEGITFHNCRVGAAVTRGGIGYIEGNSFTGTSNYNVSVGLGARIRTQKNTFGGFTKAAILNQSGIWDQPKEVSVANTYPTLTEAASAYLVEGSASIQNIARLGQKFMHVRSGRTGGTNAFSIASTTAQTLLSDGARGGADWVPFRLPAFTLYSPTFELEVLLELAFDAGHGGGELALHAAGSGATSKLCSISLASVASFKRGILRMSVVNDPGKATGSFEAHWPATGEYVGGGSTPSLDIAAIRNNTADDILYRLYWTPNVAGTEAAFFSNLRTFVVA